MKETTKNSKKFDIDGFRTDIANNVEYKELKEKYNIKTRVEFEGRLYELSKQDGKLYEYKIPANVRSKPVVSVASEFGEYIKISAAKVKEFKSELGVDKLEFGDVVLDGNIIMVELKAA